MLINTEDSLTSTGLHQKVNSLHECVTVWKEEVDCFNTSIVFKESSEERGMESRGRV